MRRPTAILLVLMGGGLALWGGTRGSSRECLEARAQKRPDAEAICSPRSSSSGHSGSGSSGYRSSSSSSGSGTSTASVSSGGFGASGAHAASGGGG